MEAMGRSTSIPRFHKTCPVLASTSAPPPASTPCGAPVTTRSPAGAGVAAGFSNAFGPGAAAMAPDAAGVVVPFANAGPCDPEQPAMAPPASSARPVMTIRRAGRRMRLRGVGDYDYDDDRREPGQAPIVRFTDMEL